MLFQIHIPTFPLNRFIENFVYCKDYKPDHEVERFFPDGNVNLVIDLTDQPKFIYDNQTLKEIQICRKVWFSGIRTRSITIPSGINSEMFIINFHKGKAYPFVKMPMYELANHVVDGEVVLSNRILDLREALLDLISIEQKFLYTEQYLLEIYGSALSVNPLIDHSVDKILQAPVSITVNSLSDEAGFSEKHFIRLFKEYVGVTPKSFQRIIRFQKSIRHIEASCITNWTNIACDCGYYDQSHFIRDFKHFSGFTPEQYLKRRGDFANYVAVG